jgi:mannose-6-phosphate isomerase-like protein (cupin superfamily)
MPATLPDGYTHGFRLSAADAMALLPADAEKRFASVFSFGQLDAEVYAPRGVDPQGPHTRDEAYIVVSGAGDFVHGDARERFGPGDFLFVPAGMVHRFENFTDDLVVWVFFFGNEAG